MRQHPEISVLIYDRLSFPEAFPNAQLPASVRLIDLVAHHDKAHSGDQLQLADWPLFYYDS